MPTLAAKAFDDSIDEQPVDSELCSDLLGCGLVRVEGRFDPQQLLTRELI